MRHIFKDNRGGDGWTLLEVDTDRDKVVVHTMQALVVEANGLRTALDRLSWAHSDFGESFVIFDLYDPMERQSLDDWIEEIMADSLSAPTLASWRLGWDGDQRGLYWLSDVHENIENDWAGYWREVARIVDLKDVTPSEQGTIWGCAVRVAEEARHLVNRSTKVNSR